MNRRILVTLATCALVLLFAFACKKDEDNNTATTDTSTTSTSATDTSSTTSTSSTDTSNTSAMQSTSTGPGATTTAAGTLDKADQEFITKAAEGGMAEVALGNLASQKATNADVKAFGSRMVTDHGKANDELKQLASGKGVTLPTGPGKDGQDTETKLQAKNGADFDKDYMSDMVKDHEKDVKEFEKESKDGKDADLKAWAAKTLPTLQEHLKMAKETEAKVKGGKK